MILSIYHEIVKMASQKKHYIMLLGFAFLMVLMVFVYWKFQKTKTIRIIRNANPISMM